ncbi:hypothetical protein A8926_6548 [Saccharopolyspora spinosa]|uniref:Uncharacterized protein n=1 Tax=Saccharopolyspora spinosa TaxID=60894 RepID=A0A2N3Y697_SACSN|nr:hypothetical protein A8926_6548 [Saccharopolyspora spinosa]
MADTPDANANAEQEQDNEPVYDSNGVPHWPGVGPQL